MSKPKYYSETQKIRPVVSVFCRGLCLDYGCGTDKIKPDAIGIDLRKTPATDIVCPSIDAVYTVYQDKHPEHIGKVDAIFSSHFLEHIRSDSYMLKSWVNLLKPGGYLILYLPDEDYYKVNNPEHLQHYTYSNFCKRLQFEFADSLQLVQSGLDVGYDKYSFYVVAKKI